MLLLFGEDADFVDAIASYKKNRLPLCDSLKILMLIFGKFQERGIEPSATLQTQLMAFASLHS
jgi:hypothetical protein